MIKKGKCIIFSAPSGSGKTTLVKSLIKNSKLNLCFSISATTRKKREGEKEGLDYFYISKDKFEKCIKQGEMLEYEEVYEGTYYGTFKKELNKLLSNHNVIFDIDVEGGIKLKNLFKENALSVFVKPPSIDELETRLKSRAKDTDHSIKIRLEKAKKELQKENSFDIIIVNDDLNVAKDKSIQIVHQFLNNQ
ncbi:MAG: guanylate kinase [Flavobacteriales bacterium]|jgi:guanylate kinase|tara:strand:+ start:657 stop:1232 length:576 start_codon:yes stop_codon:yes gene_type:complete